MGNSVIQLSEAILRFFKVLPPVDDPSPVWIKVLLFAVNYRILLSFVFALGLAVLIIGMVIVVHYLMANLVRRRRARVFISFQHEREPVADALVDELTRRGVLCVKL